jgi:dihydrofolate reductase
MTLVKADMSMSLDGFVAGTGAWDSPTGGAPLHEWLFEGDRPSVHAADAPEDFKLSETSRPVLDEMLVDAGASIVGRKFFDEVDGWGGNPPFHGAVVVLTHNPPTGWNKGGDRFSFATSLDAALAEARAKAGDRSVYVSGAHVIQQCLAAAELDVLQLHYVPVLLRDGLRLFDDPTQTRVRLEVDRVIDDPPRVTHVRYRVVK